MSTTRSGAGRGRPPASKRGDLLRRNTDAGGHGAGKGSDAAAAGGDGAATNGAARNGHASAATNGHANGHAHGTNGNGRAPVIHHAAAPRRVTRHRRPILAPPEPAAPPEPPAIPIDVRIAKATDAVHVTRITVLLADAARSGAIIAVRSAEYLTAAIKEKRAVVALQGEVLVGFAAAHEWDSGKFVSHSALVIAPEFRGRGLSRKMKQLLIELSRKRWPEAAILSLTLSHQVERMNQSFGFETVPYCDLTKDPEFWKGCDGCVHQPHLKRNQQQDCHCWAGLLLPPGKSREKIVPRDAHGHPSACSGDY